jgi:hypothetical protein
MSDSSYLHTSETPDAIAKRLMQKAHNRDGLPEIALGVLFLFFAGLEGLQVVFLPGSPAYRASSWGLMLLCLTQPLALPWTITQVRRRFLIDKVGYVALKPVNRKLSATIIGLAFVIGAAAAFAVSRGIEISSPSGWILATTGIFGGAIAAFGGRSPRFAIGGVSMAAAGILLAFSGVSLNMGLTILFGFTGLLSFVSGSIVFLILLRQPTATGEIG